MKFGTSGLRGLVVDLEGRISAIYATAFARHMMETGAALPGNRIAVGRDFRPSSPGIAATCVGALQRAGLQPVDCGAISTPALALFARRSGIAAVMVTGSHIPADRNGIKFYRPDGEIDKTDEGRIMAIADALTSDEAAGLVIDISPADAPDTKALAEQLFLARNTGLLASSALSGLRIGVYQHSTVAREMLVDVLTSYGAKVVPLGHSDTFIPVDTEAVSEETVRLLKGWAGEYELDCIVSADGDGDRPLVADERGMPLRGDLLGLIAARFLGAKTLVTPVTSNSAIETAGPFDVERTRVGSPFVIAGMSEAEAAGKGPVVGFEANGGTLVGAGFHVRDSSLDALPTRDSFLPILAVLQLAAERGEPLSAVAASFGLAHALADRIENFPVTVSAALMAQLQASPQALSAFLAPIGTVAGTTDIDGLRISLSDGRILHLRPSGNAPEMRCYVEAKNEAQARALLAQGLARIEEWAKTSEALTQ
ncbi:MAG: phosphomannomutase [Neorhizobium sp.]|nr:phosphomannomutase [Neorhizobium sp.]